MSLSLTDHGFFSVFATREHSVRCFCGLLKAHKLKCETMNDIFKYAEFRDFLRDSLKERRLRNSAYSLRAFAKDLDLRSSHLSEILSGKKGLSLQKGIHVSARLGLQSHEAVRFAELLQIDSLPDDQKKDHVRRLTQPTTNGEYRELAQDAFKAIADWYHYAILEMTVVEGFRNDSQWIARRLGITVDEVHRAVERLVRLKLLAQKNGKWMKTEKGLTTTNNISSEAIKQFNRQIIKKAYHSVSLPVQMRDLSTMTMAIDPARIDEARVLIKEFRRKLCDMFESGNQQKLYCLAVQLFPLEKSFSFEDKK